MITEVVKSGGKWFKVEGFSRNLVADRLNDYIG